MLQKIHNFVQAGTEKEGLCWTSQFISILQALGSTAIYSPYKDASPGNSALAPSSKLSAILVRHPRDQTQHSSRDRENQTSVLATNVVEELAGEKRRNGSERVPDEALARDGGAGGFAVAVGCVGVGGFEDEIDACV